MRMVPDSHRDLLADEARAMAFLATIMPDGTPQVTPLWFNTDGEHILLNAARGRVKDRNMRARPAVALCIQDPNDVNRYIQVRGRVVEIEEDTDRSHVHALSLKYREQAWEPPEGQVRITYKIAPTSVSVDS